MTKTIIPLAWDSACLMLPDGDFVKIKCITASSKLGTFMTTKGDAKHLIRKHGAVRSGPVASGMGYGLELLSGGEVGSVVFVEARQ